MISNKVKIVATADSSTHTPSFIPSELLKVPNSMTKRKGFITIYKVKNL